MHCSVTGWLDAACWMEQSSFLPGSRIALMTRVQILATLGGWGRSVSHKSMIARAVIYSIVQTILAAIVDVMIDFGEVLDN